MVIQFGWRDGAPNGVYAYDPADDETAIVSDYAYQIGGNVVIDVSKITKESFARQVGIVATMKGANEPMTKEKPFQVAD